MNIGFTELPVLFLFFIINCFIYSCNRSGENKVNEVHNVPVKYCCIIRQYQMKKRLSSADCYCPVNVKTPYSSNCGISHCTIRPVSGSFSFQTIAFMVTMIVKRFWFFRMSSSQVPWALLWLVSLA